MSDPGTSVEDVTEERVRCAWGESTPEYVIYHDEEWGTPLHGDDALFVTAVLYAPFTAGEWDELREVSVPGWLSLLALGVVCTALALALFFALIREVGPQRALVITFVNPVVAVLLGVLLLDEPFTLGIALGLPLVLVGCVLATRRSPVRTEPSELCDVDVGVP